jgi:hypothetical protein
MTLGQTPDRRVTRHLPNRIQILRQQQRFAAKPRRGSARLNPGVPGTNYDHIKRLRVRPHGQSKTVILPPNRTNAKGQPNLKRILDTVLSSAADATEFAAKTLTWSKIPSVPFLSRDNPDTFRHNNWDYIYG